VIKSSTETANEIDYMIVHGYKENLMSMLEIKAKMRTGASKSIFFTKVE
jgi:hypothetical protein